MFNWHSTKKIKFMRQENAHYCTLHGMRTLWPTQCPGLTRQQLVVSCRMLLAEWGGGTGAGRASRRDVYCPP